MTEQQPNEGGGSPRRVRATSHLVAGIERDGSFDEVPDRAFRPLGGFIDGADHSRRQIAMPDPVTQQNAGPEKIVMTAPVVLRRRRGRVQAA
jgi:hypothetical protein